MNWGFVVAALCMIGGGVLAVMSVPMRRSLRRRMDDVVAVRARIIDGEVNEGAEHTSFWWTVSREGHSESRSISTSRDAYDAHEVGDWIEVFEHPDTGGLMLEKKRAGGRWAVARGWGIALLILGFFAFGMSGAFD